MTAWQLRHATVDDLDAIMAIERRVFETDAWSAGIMREELADDHGVYLVAFPPGDPAAVAAYAGLRAPLGEPHADIQTIAVAEHARRQGLARVMLTTLIGMARQRGATHVFLEVRVDNPGAQALYRELGFEDLAVRPKYYQPDGVDALVMRLTIPAPEVTPA